MHSGPVLTPARGAAALLVLSVAAAGAQSLRPEGAPVKIEVRPGELQAGGVGGPDAVIREIHIANEDIFDLSDPDENRYVHRLLNALHVQTRAREIRRMLLMESGDVYTPGTVEESARILREAKFLSEAEIVPVRHEDGYVDLEVKTEDTWSLTPSVSFSRKGGKNSGGFRLEESNLLGTGSELEVGYKSSTDRDSANIRYRDRQVGDSRVDLGVSVSGNSDGSAQSLLVEQPFYALDARTAGGLRFDSFDQVDQIYELGEVSSAARHVGRDAAAWYGWSKGLEDGWVWRTSLGIEFSDHGYSEAPDYGLPTALPEDRRLVYPFVSREWVEDRYERLLNVEQIQRIEDLYVGTRIGIRLGYASSALGSTSDTWIAGLSAQTGSHPTSQGTLLLSGDAVLRTSSGRDSWRVGTAARFFHHQAQDRLFFAELSAETGRELDTDSLLTVGGDSTLRGYPLRYQTGDARAMLTLEQRFYTDWYPFHLFRIGAAVFFDAGRVWRGRSDNDHEGLLRDAGLGLRIGSPHSSTGRMLHIDLAWPLDGPPDQRGAQLVIETKKHF